MRKIVQIALLPGRRIWDGGGHVPNEDSPDTLFALCEDGSLSFKLIGASSREFSEWIPLESIPEEK
jgi:hypothetical protein